MARTPGGAVVAASARGQAQLAAALDDARRAAAHGIRSVLIADIGVLAAFSALRDAGLIPSDMQAKLSVMLPVANASAAAVVQRLGANTINLATDLTLHQIGAIRAAVDVPLDIYVEVPDSIGGFSRLHEIPEIIRIAWRFTPAAAISLAHELEPYEPSWIEEPVPPVNLMALEKVARKVRIPVATGERVHVRHERRELFECQAADVLQTDITSCGGLLEAKKIAAWADGYHIRVAPHNVGGPISTAAALHFATSTTNFKILEHFNDFDDASIKACAPGNPEVVDGYFALPSGAGLGVTVDEDVIRAHPPRQIYFNLFAEDWQLREAERSVAAD